jgi:peroxiredoxin
MKATKSFGLAKPVIAAAVLLAACGAALALLSAGTQAPDFTLKSVDGKTISFSKDLEGKVVVLRFFTTFFPSCADEVPPLNKLHNDYKGKGVKVVAIATDSVNGSSVEQFVRDHKVEYMVLLKDDEQKVLDDYNVRPVPCGYVIDKEGKIQLGKLGPLTGDTLTEFEEKVKSLL